MTNPPSVSSLDIAKIKRVDSIEAMLRKHMQMYDWTRSEARAINDFILTVREGVAEDFAGALAEDELSVALRVLEREKRAAVLAEDWQLAADLRGGQFRLERIAARAAQPEETSADAK